MLRFFKDDSGSTAIEYALIATLVAVVLVAAIRGIGTSTNGRFNAVAAGFN